MAPNATNTLNARFFNPARLRLLKEVGSFQVDLSEISKHCPQLDSLKYFSEREVAPSRTEKKGEGPGRKGMFQFVFGKCSPNSFFRQEVVAFLSATFRGEARTDAASPELEYVEATFDRKAGTYCQYVYAIKNYDDSAAADRIAIGACLFHLAGKDLVFVSYVARVDCPYNKQIFGFKTAPKAGAPKNFDNMKLASVFFHLAQVFGALKADLPPGAILPLWLQVSRKEKALQSHKRTGLRPAAISELPAAFKPDGQYCDRIPLILNGKSQDFSERLLTMCVDGK